MYASATYYDDLMLAAAWLYKATGSATYLAQAEQTYAVIMADPDAYQQTIYNWDQQFYAGCLMLWTLTSDRQYATQVRTAHTHTVLCRLGMRGAG